MAKIDIHRSAEPKTAKSSWTERLSQLMSQDFQLTGNTLSNADKEQLYADLHVLISSGLDIRTSLDLLDTEMGTGRQKDVLGKIRRGVLAGRSLGDVLEGISGFSEYEVHSVRIGEETGSMDEILKSLTEDYRSRIKMRREVITAFSYPLMVTTIAIFAVGFMMTFVVPLFSDLFQRMGQELPWLTQKIIGLSDFISSYWWLLIFVIIGIGLFYLAVQRNPVLRSKMDYFFIRLPWLGTMYKESVLARFTGSMAFMLHSQVSLLRALTLSSQMTGCAPLKDAIAQIEQGLLKGETLTALFSKTSIFDARFAAMVRVGEEVNQLERVFRHLSEQYSDQIQRRTKTLSTFIEPIMIGFLGILVGTILVAMYLPLFEMNSSF